MMFARYLEATTDIPAGITKYGIVSHPLFGAMFASEFDGYVNQNLMDDANLPSLLSVSMMGYVSPCDEAYHNTRLFALGHANANLYWAFGEVYSGIGGLHNGHTEGGPLATIVRISASEDASGEKRSHELVESLGSTDGLGLVQKSINSWNSKDWFTTMVGSDTFVWANGMFGQMILDLDSRMPRLLDKSYQ